jgi:NAD(P)-dependent dehydrogenase (short-subunit alcohol dehydrogenase family)
MEKTMSGKELSQKIAVVTGGGRGIGAAIAMKLAQMGATAVVCGRTRKTIDGSAEQIRKAGGKAEAIPCDVSDWNSVAALAQQVQQKFGRLDILVNNAGIGGFNSPLHSLPLENLGRDSQYKLARGISHDPGVRSNDDRRRRR